jgi:hypothetical protein
MKKNWLIVSLLSMILAACAAPGQPTPEVMVETPAPETKTAVTPEAVKATSDAHLLLAIWRESEQGGSLHLVDAQTGEDLPGRPPISLGRNYWRELSPDGKTLAVISLPVGNSPRGGTLHLIDLETWADAETQVRIDQWPTQLSFSADGSRLAIGATELGEHSLTLVDLEKRTPVTQVALDFSPLRLAFTPDGAALMAYGAQSEGSSGLNPQPLVALLDAVDLSLDWEMELNGVVDGQYAPEGLSHQALHDASVWWRPAVVLSPERQRLYLVHADADQLTTIDFAQRTARTVTVGPRRGWLDQLIARTARTAYAKELNGTSRQAVLSADGERLYVVGRKLDSTRDEYGNWAFNETMLGLQVIEVGSGLEVATLDTQATEIAWAPDGWHLYLSALSDTRWTDVVEADQLEVKAHLARQNLVAVRQSSGTRLVVSVSSHTGATTLVQLLDPTSWEVAISWTTKGYAEVVVGP